MKVVSYKCDVCRVLCSLLPDRGDYGVTPYYLQSIGERRLKPLTPDVEDNASLHVCDDCSDTIWNEWERRRTQ